MEEPDVRDVEDPDVVEPEADEPSILRVGVIRAPDCWNPFTCLSVWF